MDTNLPYVALPEVDDSYPPQKKSFLMLKFMNDYFGDKYKFFMRADDDVFVNVQRLKTFLESLNSSDNIYIGQTGVGNKEEFGQLSLDSHDNFCMGGPGVIISFKTLSKIAANVENCLNNLYSTHEDVEVGRCLKKNSGISCSWSYDMQNLFYHNSSIQDSILNNIPPSKELLNAITIHPIKNSLAMKNLYLYFKSIFYQNLNFKLSKNYRKLAKIMDDDFLFKMNSLFPSIKNYMNEAKNMNFTPSISELMDNSMAIWKYFSQKFYTEHSLNPRKNIEKDIIQAFNHNMKQIMALINRNSFKKGTLFDYHSLYNGYVKFNLNLGTQYVLDFLMIYRKYQGKRLTIPLRKHVYAVQTFSPIRLIKPEPNDSIDSLIVNVIISLAGRSATFQRFCNNFANIMQQDTHITLTIVTFSTNETKDNEIKEILYQTNIKASILEINGKFSRGTALQRSLSLFNNDSLLFFLDVDMLFNQNVLNRVRRNTIMGKQVYFPIVFSQYNNNWKKFNNSSPATTIIDSIMVDDNIGYWRQFGYGIVSSYKNDLTSVGGYDINIDGWGMEDVNLYDRFISSNINIFRSIDPDLIHVYHDIHCDKQLSLKQYEMCLGTKFFSLNSIENLSNFIHTEQLLID